MSTRFRRNASLVISILALIAAFLNACASSLPPAPDRTSPVPVSPAVSPTYTPFRPLALGQALPVGAAFTESPLPETPAEQLPVETQVPAETTSPRPAIWLDPAVPSGWRESFELPAEFAFARAPGDAALRIQPGGGELGHWVYALAAPFPTQVEAVTFEDVRLAWQGQPSGPFAGRPLLLDENTLAAWSVLWGPPAPGAVKALAPESLLDAAWQERSSWALLPFEALEPRWKVLTVAGQSPLWKSFDPEAYPLSLPIGLQGDPALVDGALAAYGGGSLAARSNRDPARLTVLVMTGVTALVRATAFTMEQRGVLYPAKDIGPLLADADLTHISNEVPFAKGCPAPDPVQEGMRFCSDPRYIELMEAVGTDIVELTGDHFQDWGNEAMLYTLDLYRERNWLYYGGGKDLQEARQAITVEHNGNRLAFIGCNAKGGGYAQAGPKHPGAVKCDWEVMVAEIARLRDAGYIPVATFQHFEYYTYQAQPNQKADSRRLVDAGAVIVSGSQAHQPQALEFYDGALIHYGLGNLFFDQYDVSLATRQAFIDRHVFYAGRHISTELLPILFVDYARPRPMTGDERRVLFNTVFKASGW